MFAIAFLFVRVLRDCFKSHTKVRRDHCAQVETRTAAADGRWHLDEVFVSINGRQLYVWRAVDSEGEVLDILVQARRDRKAALKLMRKILKKQGVTRSEEHTSELQSQSNLVCRLLLEKKQ